MDEGQTPGSTPDAGEALRAEMHDIMTNPANALHAGYTRGDAAVLKEIDTKYKSVYGSGTVDLLGRSSVSVGSATPTQDNSTPADAAIQAHNNAVLTNLETKHGSTDAVIRLRSDATATIRHFSPDEHSAGQVRAFADQIGRLGPEAEARTIEYLADIQKIIKGG